MDRLNHNGGLSSKKELSVPQHLFVKNHAWSSLRDYELTHVVLFQRTHLRDKTLAKLVQPISVPGWGPELTP